MFTRALMALSLVSAAALAADPLPQCTLPPSLPQCTLPADPPALTLAAVNLPAEQRHESLERRVEALEREVADLKAQLKLARANGQPQPPQATIPARQAGAAACAPAMTYQQPVTYFVPQAGPVMAYTDAPAFGGGACAGGNCGTGGARWQPFGGRFRIFR